MKITPQDFKRYQDNEAILAELGKAVQDHDMEDVKTQIQKILQKWENGESTLYIEFSDFLTFSEDNTYETRCSLENLFCMLAQDTILSPSEDEILSLEIISLLINAKNVPEKLASLGPLETFACRDDIPFLLALLLAGFKRYPHIQWPMDKYEVLLTPPTIIDAMNIQNLAIDLDQLNPDYGLTIDPKNPYSTQDIRLSLYPPFMAFMVKHDELFDLYCQHPNVIWHLLKQVILLKEPESMYRDILSTLMKTLITKSQSWFLNLFLCMRRLSLQKINPKPALPREMELAIAKTIAPAILFEKPETRSNSIRDIFIPPKA